MKSNFLHIGRNDSSIINVTYSDNEKSSYCLALSKKTFLRFKHSNFNFFVQLKNVQQDPG